MAYHDFADTAERDRSKEMLATVRAEGLMLPVTTVDGEVLLQGYLSFWDIAQAVEARTGQSAIAAH